MSKPEKQSFVMRTPGPDVQDDEPEEAHSVSTQLIWGAVIVLLVIIWATIFLLAARLVR